MQLGRFGLWVSPRALGPQDGPTSAALAQELGFGTYWLGGSPRLPSVRPLLERRRLTSAPRPE